MPPPLAIIYVALSLVVHPLVWLKGGHAERLGSAICLVSVLGTHLTHPIGFGEISVGETVMDLGALGFYAWMAVRGRRWWPSAAVAVMMLILITHVAPPLVSELTYRGGTVARLALSSLLLLVLLFGVLERWLAGEAVVSGARQWTRRRTA